MKVRNQRLKKSKTRYFYSDDENEILGETDDPCRTMINLFNAFSDNRNRKVFFDIDNPKKTIINKEKSLQYQEVENTKVYKYQGKVVNREDFIILLGCEET